MPDYRSDRKKKHDLAEMLACLIIACSTGHTTLRRAVKWCQSSLKKLRKYMELKNGIPSVSTLSRALSHMNEEDFLELFMMWIGEIVDSRGRHIAIDGKALRGSTDKAKQKRTPLLLHAIDAETGIVLSQFLIPDKSGEIRYLPKILELLDLENSLVTIDAIGTQTASMEKILELCGHFLLLVKSNQHNAYEEIKDFFKLLKAEKDEGFLKPYSRVDSREKTESAMNIGDVRRTQMRSAFPEPGQTGHLSKAWDVLPVSGF